MEKRYQVFVSSTYEDLRDERQEVMQALLELDCIPAGMELFPAGNEDQWTLIKKVIDDCDYYIVVIGGRYGTIGPEGISYTQMEYEYALSQNKPVIGFIHKDPAKIPAGKSEKSSEGQKKLQEFRNLVQQKMCRSWESPVELGSVVSRSVIKLIKNSPAIGWVKADLVPDISTTEEILRLRQKIEELQTQLSESQQVSPIGTENLAQGNDKVEIHYSYFLYSERKSNNESVMFSNRYKTISDVYLTTWNDLFSLISPLLIDEASDLTIKNAISEVIISGIKNPDEIRSFSRNQRINIDENDFNMIKVQLIALKLISKSIKRKNRSVNDKATYWTLTHLGENQMMVLRAILRKSDVIGSNSAK